MNIFKKIIFLTNFSHNRDVQVVRVLYFKIIIISRVVML